MQIFSPDGKYGYVCSSFTPQTVVITVADHQIVGRVTQPSLSCPNIAATPDGTQVWFTLKDSHPSPGPLPLSTTTRASGSTPTTPSGRIRPSAISLPPSSLLTTPDAPAAKRSVTPVTHVRV